MQLSCNGEREACTRSVYSKHCSGKFDVYMPVSNYSQKTNQCMCMTSITWNLKMCLHCKRCILTCHVDV